MSAAEYPKPRAVALASVRRVLTTFLTLVTACIVASCVQSRPSTRDKAELKALTPSGQRLEASQMETATTPMDLVYRFEQVVDAMFRETDETAPVQESYVRSGLILLSRRYVDGQVQLELHEYETGGLVLDRLIGGLAMDRATLEQLDREAHSRRQLDFGLTDSLLLVPVSAEGEPQNGDAGKLRFDQIYLPGVLPSVAMTELPPVGHSRTDRLAIRAGAGRFDLEHTVRLVERGATRVVLEVSLAESPVVVEMGRFTLTSRAQGSFVVELSTDNQLAVRKSGSYRFEIWAKGHNLDDIPVDIKVIDYQVQCRLDRIPLRFDQSRVAALEGG